MDGTQNQIEAPAALQSFGYVTYVEARTPSSPWG
jgi:hypothetical protein